MQLFIILYSVLVVSLGMYCSINWDTHLNHMKNEDSILSSQKNMEYVYEKDRSAFDFHYDNLHIVNPDGRLMILKNNVAIIGIDEIGSNEKKSLNKIIYIEKTIDKYEKHHDIVYCNQDDINELTRNIYNTNRIVDKHQIEKNANFEQKHNVELNNDNEKTEILEILKKKYENTKQK